MAQADESQAAKTPRTRTNALELYKLARDEELRRLDSQRDQLDSMRQRTGQYLAFVGAVTAFLAGSGLRASGVEGTTGVTRDWLFFTIAGLASFTSLVTIFLAISILLALQLPSLRITRWKFILKPGAALSFVESDVPRPDETDLVKYIAQLYAKMSKYNQPELRRLRYIYVGFLGLGAFQLMLWTALVWLRA